MEEKKGVETNVKYDPVYARQIYRHMANGYSFASFATIPRVDKRTLYNWLESREDFKEAYEDGKEEYLRLLELASKKLTTGLDPGYEYLNSEGELKDISYLEEYEQETIKQELSRLEKLGAKINGPQLRFMLESRYRKEYSKRLELANPDGSNISGGSVVVLEIPTNGRDK